MLDELVQRPPEVPLPYRNHAVEAFLLDGPHEAFRVRVAVWRVERRLYHAHPRFFSMRRRCAPLRVPGAAPRPAVGKRSLVGGRQRAAALTHEGLVWMPGTADDLHAARREVDHEARVV